MAVGSIETIPFPDVALVGIGDGMYLMDRNTLENTILRLTSLDEVVFVEVEEGGYIVEFTLNTTAKTKGELDDRYQVSKRQFPEEPLVWKSIERALIFVDKLDQDVETIVIRRLKRT